MAKNKSCVKMLPSTYTLTFNKNKDEFNTNTNDSLKLPKLQDGKGVIQNHVDFSKDGNYKILYNRKFIIYKSTKCSKNDFVQVLLYNFPEQLNACQKNQINVSQ